MYYRDADAERYGVKLAPLAPDAPDKTPPSRPTAVQLITNCAANQFTLTWAPANDLDTGVAGYYIHRNGELIETVIGTQYVSALENETTVYTVTAVNYHNTPGQTSLPISANSHDHCR